MNTLQNKTDTKNNLCCIVIPIYKKELTEHEIISLKQCCNILGQYPIFFITHNKLDCSSYDMICNSMGVSCKYEYFHEYYFHNMLCYSALMISKSLYEKFQNYDYMLIYQLDAYVFKDELEYWCKKGYDYIGAPWLKLNTSKKMPEFFVLPDTGTAVGNGGFSLRNIKRTIEKHSIILMIISFIRLYESCYNEIVLKSKKNYFYFIPRLFLRFPLRALESVFLKSNNIVNEDMVWSHLFHKEGNVPPAIEAMKFSFEMFPEYLYKMNNEKLPFGCHAWFIDQNHLFYKEHIKVNL